MRFTPLAGRRDEAGRVHPVKQSLHTCFSDGPDLLQRRQEHPIAARA
jgi:hypothetical protein